MGAVHSFDLQRLIDVFDLRYFVETGTGRGNGIAHATRFGFRRIISSEIVAEQASVMGRTFAADARVEIHAGRSFEVLEQTLPALADGNICFWLDAHYPGADLGLNDYDYEQDLELRLPLLRELETIRQNRLGRAADVILIDDLRIYEQGPFASKNLTELGLGHIAQYGRLDLTPFQATHKIERLYRDDGYVALLPLR
jgi:hypothetical protein